MKQFLHVEDIAVTDQISIVNIYDNVRNAIVHSHVNDGFVIISSRHPTTAVTINQHEERFLSQFKKWISKTIPKPQKAENQGSDDENNHLNVPCNIMAMLMGSSETIPFSNRRLQLDRTQSVFLVDLDGPGKRDINIYVIGEQKQGWQ